MSASVYGLDGLQKALKQFPKNVQKNIMRGAVRAGAAPIVQEAKSNVAKDTGNLEKSIGVVTGKPKNKNFTRVWVTPRVVTRSKSYKLKDGTKWKITGTVADGWYAHFKEFGTVNMPADPFMRPAYENKGEEAIKATKDYLAKRIDKEVQKARK